MDFGTLPPEVNSGRMYAGAGSGPMLAAAAAWDKLATELHSVGMSYESVISELANGWMGPSATAMAAAAEPYATWMHEAAAQAEHTAGKAKAAVAAYETAHSTVVPPPVVAANRSQLSSLVSSNLLGQNTSAIAATEAAYGDMWAQDATALYGYAGNSSAASQLTPFNQPPQTTNPEGSGNQAAAAGQSTASTAGSNAQNALSAAPQAMQALTSPGAAQAGSSGILGTLLAGLPEISSDPALAVAYTGLAASLFGTFGIDAFGSFGVDAAGSFGIDMIGVAESFEAETEAGFLGGLPAFGGMPFEASASSAAASMGQASPVGALSVPRAWTAVAPPPIQSLSTGTALTAASGAEAAPAVAASKSGLPLAEMATAGLAGRATTAAGRGRRNQGSATGRESQATQHNPSNGRISAIAPELRELAELRDAGIITDDEFVEQKRRLLQQ